MIELKYPAADVQAEMFPLVDADGHVVGSATRRYCHGGSMALHPVVHLHVIDSQGRLYLQQRSMTKDIAPGRWDTAVGGHVDYGETLTQAVVREAREELGLHVAGTLAPEGVTLADAPAGQLVFLFQYVWQSSRERELVTAFALRYDGPLQPDHDEVDDGRFWPVEALAAVMSAEADTFTEQLQQAEWPRLQSKLSSLS